MRYVSLHEVPEEGVSHDPDIRKQVWIRNGEVPHLTNVSQSRFEPGQRCETHVHADMVEVFLVQAGRGTIVVDGQPHVLAPGVCVVVEPGEAHALANDGAEPLVLTYFGLVV